MRAPSWLAVAVCVVLAAWVALMSALSWPATAAQRRLGGRVVTS